MYPLVISKTKILNRDEDTDVQNIEDRVLDREMFSDEGESDGLVWVKEVSVKHGTLGDRIG